MHLTQNQLCVTVQPVACVLCELQRTLSVRLSTAFESGQSKLVMLSDVVNIIAEAAQ